MANKFDWIGSPSNGLGANIVWLESKTTSYRHGP